MNTSAPPELRGGCPTREELSAFNAGQLAGSPADALAAHVGQCPQCLAVLEALDTGPEAELAEWRHPVPAELFSEAAGQSVERVVERVGSWLADAAGPAPPPTPGPAAAPAAMEPPAPPQRLGAYQLLSKLGRGAMGTVYKARHVRLGKIVAVKVLPPGRWQNPHIQARFRREMELLAGLKHPNIVEAHDGDIADGVAWLMMEYVEGVDLAQLLRRAGPLPITDACEVIRQAAAGLQHAYAQRGVVHRDIKPSNLMVSTEGTVKVLDLGLARIHRAMVEADEPADSALTSADDTLGTADYMAPEQWLDPRVDPRADIYSLGCTLYHLLAGAAPFSGPDYDTAGRKMMAHANTPPIPIRQLRPEVPDGLAAVLGRMMAKERTARFETSAAVAEALLPFAAGSNLARMLDAPASPPGAKPSVAPPSRRRAGRRQWLIGGALAAAVLGVAVALGLRWPAGPPTPLRITSMDIQHWNSATPRHSLGLIGLPSRTTHAGDFVRVKAVLDRPAYCYLIVYKPDGRDALCYPRGPAEKVKEVVYPPEKSRGSNPEMAYCLDEGTGTEAFVLVTSPEPLPPYETWRCAVGQVQWEQMAADVPWRFDGQDFEALDGRPRAERPLHPMPAAFVEVCQHLKKYPGVEAVQGYVFPVRKPAD